MESVSLVFTRELNELYVKAVDAGRVKPMGAWEGDGEHSTVRWIDIEHIAMFSVNSYCVF